MLKLATAILLLSVLPVAAAPQNATPDKIAAVADPSNAPTDLATAQSRAIDTDYAAEVAAQVKDNILDQAGLVMQAQANAQPLDELQSLQD